MDKFEPRAYIPVDLRSYVESLLTMKAQRVWADAVCYKLKEGQTVRFVMQRGTGLAVVLGHRFRDASENLNKILRAEKATREGSGAR
jgi:hypothetical protein